MALQITFEDVHGTTHPEAYARIQQTIITNKPGGIKSAQTEVWVYATQAAYAAGKSPVWGRTYQVEQPSVADPEVMECAIDPDAATVADVYLWLKTQDAYKTSTDV